jgi:hypothetical protein
VSGRSAAGEPEIGDSRLDRIAWEVLSDLMRRQEGLGTLTPEGLQHLIGLRLQEEADELGVSPERMGAAFDRALRELVGADRPPPEETAPDDDPLETVDDL